MNIEDIKRKNEIIIKYLQSLNFNDDFKFKAEYSTNDNDKKIVVVQESMGEKIVFFGDCPPLFNYYSVQIFGDSIEESKQLSVDIGYLIGKSVKFTNIYIDSNNESYEETWQIIFKQFSNPQTIEYYDIRRVGYTATLKCIVNMIAKNKLNN